MTPMWAALIMLWSAAAQTAPCDPQVDVRGPGVPIEVVAEFRAQAIERTAVVADRLGASPCTPVRITLVPSMDDAPTLDPPWHLPSWAAGAAEPAVGRIVVGIVAGRMLQDRARTLDHELAHVLLHAAVDGEWVPRWFDEGVARLVAGEHGAEDLSVLARARLASALVPLDALQTGFPPGQAAAALAYAEAGRAVSLIEGRGQLRPLLLMLAAHVPFETALQSAIGRASWQLSVDVERSISRWRALAIVGVETDIAMALCAVMVVVVGHRARRRLRERIAAMEDDAPSWGWPVSTSVVQVTRWTVRPRP